MDYKIEDLNANNVTSEGLFNLSSMLTYAEYGENSDGPYFKTDFVIRLRETDLNFVNDFTDAQVKNGLESLKFISQLGGEFEEFSIEYHKDINAKSGDYYFCHRDKDGFTTNRWNQAELSLFGYQITNYMENCMLDFPEFSKRTGFLYLTAEEKAEIDADIEAGEYDDYLI